MVSLDGQWTSADADATALSENSLMVRTVKKCSGEVRIFYLLFILIESVFFSSSKLLMHISY